MRLHKHCTTQFPYVNFMAFYILLIAFRVNIMLCI